MPLTTHICNEEDWKKFYQPNFKQKDQINFYKENNFLICLDENQTDLEGKEVKLHDLKLYGKDYNSSGILNWYYLPCKPKKWTQEREDRKEKCLIKDLSDKDMKSESKFMKKRFKETMSYLLKKSLPTFEIYYNMDKIILGQYGKNSVTEESYIGAKVFEPNKPSWMANFISHDSLEDETDLI
jgi:hypothetical protein